MSSTRRAQPGSAPKQERFCSSPEFDRGLMANLVAKRCQLLTVPEHREIVYFLQLLSHEEGGLKAVADALIKRFSEKVCTQAMQGFGIDPTRIYSPEEVEKIWGGVEDPVARYTLMDLDPGLLNENYRPRTQAQKKRFSCRNLLEMCTDAAKLHLADFLSELCLNPALTLSRADAPGILRSCLNAWLSSKQNGFRSARKGAL